MPRTGAVRDGLRTLWHDRVLRVLALCIVVMNVTRTGTLAVLVRYAFERLGLGPTGYGVLTASIAVGGLFGTCTATGLVERFGASLLSVGGSALGALVGGALVALAGITALREGQDSPRRAFNLASASSSRAAPSASLRRSFT